jgi:hypothetical protein
LGYFNVLMLSSVFSGYLSTIVKSPFSYGFSYGFPNAHGDPPGWISPTTSERRASPRQCPRMMRAIQASEATEQDGFQRENVPLSFVCWFIICLYSVYIYNTYVCYVMLCCVMLCYVFFMLCYIMYVIYVCM